MELADFNQGTPWGIQHKVKLEMYLSSFSDMIKRVFLVGGSFDMQKDYIESLKDISRISKKYNKPLYLFSRNNLEDIPKDFKKYCDFIKTGAYIKELETDDNVQYGIRLATSNQKIYEMGLDY